MSQSLTSARLVLGSKPDTLEARAVATSSVRFVAAAALVFVAWIAGSGLAFAAAQSFSDSAVSSVRRVAGQAFETSEGLFAASAIAASLEYAPR